MRNGYPMTSGDRLDQAAFAAARQDSGTPTVQLAHPRQGVWSGKNQLGVELPFELDANRMQTVFKMDEWGFPEVWTISLGITVPPLVLNQLFDVSAEINFGAGGITQTFECDWVEGTIFSLPMNAINVRAKINSLAFLAGVPPPDGIRISTLVSRGGIRHARATKTDFMGNLAVGANYVTLGAPPFFAPIPAFARSVIVTPTNPGDAANLYNAASYLQFLVNEQTAIPAPIQTIPGNLLGPTTSFKIPIPATARYFTFHNGGGAPVSGQFIWNLFDE